MTYVVDPSVRQHKIQKIHHTQPDSTSDDPGEHNYVESSQYLFQNCTELEVFRCDKDQPDECQGFPFLDSQLLDLIILLDSSQLDPSISYMRREDDSYCLGAVVEDQTVSSSRESTSRKSNAQDPSEPIRYTLAPSNLCYNLAPSNLRLSPPRRFYRTFWRAMARKVCLLGRVRRCQHN
jgi:hypothetical protein